VVVIGLYKGKVEGIEGAGAKESDWRQAPVDLSRPPVPARFRTEACINQRGRDDKLMVVEVNASDRVHSNHRDEVYLRIGDETRKLNFAQRRELEFDKGQSNFETTAPRTSEGVELDEALLNDFAEHLGHPDPGRLLASRGVVDRVGKCEPRCAPPLRG
jgi:ATP-dependent DNA helicase RecG